MGGYVVLPYGAAIRIILPAASERGKYSHCYGQPLPRSGEVVAALSRDRRRLRTMELRYFVRTRQRRPEEPIQSD